MQLQPTLLFLETDQDQGLALWRGFESHGLRSTIRVVPSVGTPLAEWLDDHVDASALVVIASPEAATSARINRLIERFVAHQGVGDLYLIAYPGKASDLTNCVPTILLSHRNGGTGRLDPAEPPEFAASLALSSPNQIASKLAYQLRPGQAGVSHALRPFVRAAASPVLARTGLAVSLLLALGLGSWAVMSQSALTRAESEAVHARLASADLIFMLEDRLSSEARSEVVTTLEDEIYAIANYRLEEASEDTISNIAHLLNAVGQARMQEGELQAALDAYTRAAGLTDLLLAAAPDNPERIFDHSQSVFWIGDAALTAGEIAIAEEQFTRYRELADQLVTLDPNNLTYRAEQAYSRVNSGATALERSDMMTAQTLFAEAIERYEGGLVEAGAVSRSSLANAYGWSARASRSLGDLSRALSEIETEIATRRQLVLESPESRSQRRQLAHAEHGRLSILIDLGRTDEVEAEIDTLASDLAVLASEMPDSRPTRRIQLAVLRLRASLALWNGDLTRAKLLSDRAQADYADGPGAESEDERHIDGGYYDLLAAEIALASGAYDSALGEASSALAKFERGIAVSGPRFAHYAAASALIIGDVHAATGRSAEAERAWRRGLNFIASMESPRELRAQDIQARLLSRLGREGDAETVMTALAEAGYGRPDYMAFQQSPPPSLTAQSFNDNGDQDG